MNKTVIKNFAIWARNKLIADVQYRSGLMGITEKGIQNPLPQSTSSVEFYDIGTAEPYSIAGHAIQQRKRLVHIIRQKEKDSDYPTAYKYILEEVAYTWFNRLIAIRFMEVNDYLPSHIRVLSSESGKVEPDLVTTPFDAGLDFTPDEEQALLRLKNDNKLDEAFRLLFIKQCNALNAVLPALFEQTSDYTELLLSLSVVDQEGVVYRLVHDIAEEDFNVEKGGQVEIIGWLYQYYNTDLNEQVYDGSMSKSRIPKELLPAATTIYTPHWSVRYMVENSLGRLWVEGHPDGGLKAAWKYYLEEAPQEPEVEAQLAGIRKEYAGLRPEDIRLIDPCMGSGHILVYAFDVLMQIYESAGYSQRDAAQSILEHNLYGLDIDDRAAQLAYFAVMMKARQYDRRILTRRIQPHIHAIVESNALGGAYKLAMGDFLLSKEHQETLNYLLDAFLDAKEYGSILQLENRDYAGLLDAWRLTASQTAGDFNLTLWYTAVEHEIPKLIEQAIILTQKYDVIVTNPPYLGSSRFSPALDQYVKDHYATVKSDLSMAMYKAAIDHFAKSNSFIGFITTSSWMFLSSFEKLRYYLNDTVSIYSLVDFGTELFDGKVGHNPIVSWVTRKAYLDYKMTAIRLVDYCYSRRDEKEPEFFNPKNRYTAQQSNFSKIPGSPVAYWVSKQMLSDFERGISLENIAYPRQGMATTNNGLFLRQWFEVIISRVGFNLHSEEDTNGKYKWFPYNKGGEFRKWYGNNDYVVNFQNKGAEVCAYIDAHSAVDHKGRVINRDKYFKPSVTWSKISSGAIAFRYKPNGFIFDVAGTSIFGNEIILDTLMCFLNSKVALSILSSLSPTLNYEVGHICSIPVLPQVTDNKGVAEEAIENREISKSDWDSYETSWDFKRHPMVCRGGRLADDYAAWKAECEQRFLQLKANEEELNRIFIDIYGLQDELTPEVADKDVTVHRIFDTKDDVPESMRGSNYVRTMQDEVVSLLSYAVGCMFGRYSLDVEGLAYAGGAWDAGKYRSFVPDKDGIIPITDEDYLEDDVITRLCDWLKAAYGGDTLEANLDFIAKALGGKGNSSREIIRGYFLKDFYKDHCKTYQKRPIYWLFDSGKQNGFKALIYLHRYTPDTIGNLRVDYLHKMQRVYESEIGRMQDMIDHSTSSREVAASTKRKEKLQKQLKECRDYDEKIAHLALSRIELDLDDGVKVNYRKVQTAADGKFYEVLADSKNIMGKEKNS